MRWLSRSLLPRQSNANKKRPPITALAPSLVSASVATPSMRPRYLLGCLCNHGVGEGEPRLGILSFSLMNPARCDSIMLTWVDGATAAVANDAGAPIPGGILPRSFRNIPDASASGCQVRVSDYSLAYGPGPSFAQSPLSRKPLSCKVNQAWAQQSLAPQRDILRPRRIAADLREYLALIRAYFG